MNRIYTLDALRGICATLVMLRHFPIRNSILDIPFVQNGNAFVEYFFALSGFVLAQRYFPSADFDFRRFFKRRVKRLFPLHIFTLFLVLITESLKGIAVKLGYLNNVSFFSGPTSFKEFLPNLFLIHNWTNFSNHMSFNQPSWSISIELLLYVIFGVTFLPGKKQFKFCWWLILLLAITLYCSGITILHGKLSRGILSFSMGTVAFIIFQYLKKIKISIRISTLLETICILAVYFIVSYDNFPYHRIFLNFTYFFTILVFVRQAGHVSKFMQNKYLVRVGDYSYSIYLLHSIIFIFFKFFGFALSKIFNKEFIQIIDNEKFVNMNNYFLNSFLVLVFTMIIIYISKLTYERIEMVWLKRST